MVSEAGCPNWYKRLFAWMMAHGNEEYEQAIAQARRESFAERKQTLFADLHGTVLEIGPGSGVNLSYYPTSVHWIGVEPNPFMHPYIKKVAQQQGLHIDLRRGTAEHLEVADNRIDVVVSTLVLCSVPDLPKTLQEILRVLKPGGRFLFIEHVAAPQGTGLRRVQQAIRPMWKVLGDGCHPDRETGLALKQAGFGRVDYQDFSGPFPIPVVKPHIIGVAYKPVKG